mmetsp:Transcript_71933/g.116632  ORF Transcript_71933/g.116632 Transcript_71933/m.116632 type:complete len:133 (-) Transcript_71933:267-665(-)
MSESRAKSARNPIAHLQVTKKSSSTPKSPTTSKTQHVLGVAGRHMGHNNTMAISVDRDVFLTSSNDSVCSIFDTSDNKEAPMMFTRVPSTHCMITRTVSSAMEVDFQALWGAPPGGTASVAQTGSRWNGGWP